MIETFRFECECGEAVEVRIESTTPVIHSAASYALVRHVATFWKDIHRPAAYGPHYPKETMTRSETIPYHAMEYGSLDEGRERTR